MDFECIVRNVTQGIISFNFEYCTIFACVDKTDNTVCRSAISSQDVSKLECTFKHIGHVSTVHMLPKNKPCKRNNRQISDNTKIAAKQGNAEERPDAGCEIKRWKAAAEMSSFFNIPPDISKADKPREFEGGTLISRQAANLSSKYIAN